MSFKDIIVFFVAQYNGAGIPPTLGRTTRSNNVDRVITYIFDQAEIRGVCSTEEPTIDLCLVSLEPPHQLKPGQINKLKKTLRLVNQDKYPTTFDTEDWVTAYELNDKPAAPPAPPRKLTKPSETLVNFTFDKTQGDVHNLLTLLISLQAWGGPMYSGAARYLGTERNALNQLVHITQVDPLDNQFDQILHSKLQIILQLDPILEGRVLQGQATGRLLYETIINTLISPLDFPRKQFEYQKNLNSLKSSDFTSIDHYFSARNKNVRVLKLLATEVPISTLYTTLLIGKTGVQSFQHSYVQFSRLPPSVQNYADLEQDLTSWDKLRSNVPAPEVAIREMRAELLTFTTNHSEAKMNAVSTNGGGRGGGGRGGRGGGGRGKGSGGDSYRSVWNDEQHTAYKIAVAKVRATIDAMVPKPTSEPEPAPAPNQKGSQVPPNTNMHRAAVACPSKYNEGSGVTAFVVNNPIDSNYPGLTTKSILGLTSSEYSTDC